MVERVFALKTDVDASASSSDAAAAAASAAAAAASEAATAADLVLTNADVVLTNADVVSTNADVVSTNADAAATAADVIAAAASAAAALVSENAAAASAAAAAAAAANPSMAYNYDSGTTQGAAAGEVRLSAADFSTISGGTIWLSDTDINSNDLETFIQTWDTVSNTTAKGYITLTRTSDGAQVIFSVQGAATDEAGPPTDTSIVIDYEDGATGFTDGDQINVLFTLSGADGAGGGDVSSGSNFTTDHALVRTDTATGVKNVQETGILIDDSDAMSGLASLGVTGNITVGGTVDGRDIATDGTKLDGIEAAADVTDTTNVTAAGALMDSEVDADIKTLTLPANTTISAFGATLIDDAAASNARTTLGVDAAGTDNSTDVTLAGTPDYITISGQEITRNAIDLAADVTGTLPVGNGGTGATTLTDGGILLGSGTGAITAMAALADGSIVVGDGTTDPVALAAFTSSTGDLLGTKGGSKGQQTVVWNAADFLPEDGAAGPELSTVAGTNHDYEELLYDGASTEKAFLKTQMPKGADESTDVVFEVAYAPKGTSSGNVRWQISVLAVGDGDTIDSAFTSSATADDSAAGATANVEQRSGEISVTPDGTWAGEDTFYIMVERVGGHANDTNTDDCGLLELRMHYTAASGHDD